MCCIYLLEYNMIKNNGQYMPEILDLDATGYDLQITYRDTTGKIFVLHSIMQLDLDEPTEHKTISDFTIGGAYYAGGGKVSDKAVVDLINAELQDYYDYDLIQDVVADNRCGNY